MNRTNVGADLERIVSGVPLQPLAAVWMWAARSAGKSVILCRFGGLLGVGGFLLSERGGISGLLCQSCSLSVKLRLRLVNRG